MNEAAMPISIKVPAVTPITVGTPISSIFFLYY